MCNFDNEELCWFSVVGKLEDAYCLSNRPPAGFVGLCGKVHVAGIADMW